MTSDALKQRKSRLAFVSKNYRVNAVKQLDKIAIALGDDRTNSELLPYAMGKDSFIYII